MVRVIVAREEGESNFLTGYRKQYPSLKLTSHGGPFAILDGDVTAADVALAACVVGRYSQGRTEPFVEFEYCDRDGQLTPLRVVPMDPDDLPDDAGAVSADPLDSCISLT